MNYGPAEALSVRRARWLAELSQALEDAEKLIWRLGVAQRELYGLDLQMRIDAARLEVQALWLGRPERLTRNPDPEWSRSSPWQPGQMGLG